MKIHGTISYLSGRDGWRIDTEPHVRMKLRQVFPSLKDEQHLLLSNSPSNALDLEWVLLRYPHEMDSAHATLLRAICDAAREREEECVRILNDPGRLAIELSIPLRDYQQQGVALAMTAGGLLVGDVLGLGKTAIGIGLIAHKEARPAVIMCQTHLQKQWRAEILKFAPLLGVDIAKKTKPHDTNGDVLIISYSKIAGWKDMLHGKVKTVVFDEMQEMRHDDTSKYRAAKMITDGAKYLLGLTATPVYNYGGEIWNIVNLLKPGSLGSHWEFCKEWCGAGNSRGGKWIVDDPIALGAHLREQHLFIRRTRCEVSRELPPITRLAELVPYDDKIMKDISENSLQLAKRILHGTFIERGEAARLFDIQLRQATGIAKAPFVAEFVADMVGAGEKVLLFGWHREVYDVWKAKFTAAEVPHWFYTGSESTAGKCANAEAFIKHKGGGVFIMSLRSGAGLDGLQMVTSTVVFGELDWSPQVHEQCIGRAARDGQEEPVSVVFLVSDAGSDPLISQLLGIKLGQSHCIVDPDVPIADVPAAERILKSSIENRVTELAKDFLKRYGSTAAESQPQPNPTADTEHDRSADHPDTAGPERTEADAGSS